MKYLSNDMPFYHYLTIKSIAANLCELSVKELLLKLRWLKGLYKGKAIELFR
jgi:hypothetical protein